MKTIPRAIATALTALIAVACGAGSDSPSGGFGRALEHLPDTPDVRGGIWVADIALQRELFQIALLGENVSDDKVWNCASSIRYEPRKIFSAAPRSLHPLTGSVITQSRLRTGEGPSGSPQ